MGPLINPFTGELRIANGFIAIGPLALGIIAFGGQAHILSLIDFFKTKAR